MRHPHHVTGSQSCPLRQGILIDEDLTAPRGLGIPAILHEAKHGGALHRGRVLPRIEEDLATGRRAGQKLAARDDDLLAGTAPERIRISTAILSRSEIVAERECHCLSPAGTVGSLPNAM